jgi:7,8-dihydropterin-6-yl-methyl-4-(beta-D-ribofuranosyl)aminobenzene 5'-phosphate synthase
MKLEVVYDNTSLSPELVAKWGFACLVNDHLLFDTGGDGPTLLANMDQMGIDPQAVDAVVISHDHGDHTGGLAALLGTGVRPTVYLLSSFSSRLRADARSLTKVVELEGPAEIQPGMHTTGTVGSGIAEQALVVQSDEGLVVVTGCAHPGVLEMVRRAKETVSGDVALVMGGFHLGGASPGRVAQVGEGMRKLGVERIAPCHCTGEEAIQLLAKEYGEHCLGVGVGRVIGLG